MQITLPENTAIPEPTIDNKLEILKFASQVQSRIKKDISEDFILAKLDEKNKEAIIEMTSNAYFVKKIFMIIKEKGTKWAWNEKQQTWNKRKLNTEEKEMIHAIAQGTFDTFLTRIYMTVILNRNIEENTILKLLMGAKEEEETQQNQEIENKIKALIKPENEEKR